MIKTVFDLEEKRVHLQLEEEIASIDFEHSAEAIRHYLLEGNTLETMMISVEKFQHWESFSENLKHFKVDSHFIKQIRSLAIVTDTATLEAGKKLGELFTATKIHIYSYCEFEKAEDWLKAPVDQDMKSIPAS